MSDKKDTSFQADNFTEQDRRKAVKNILAGSGLTLAAATSAQWSKPLIESVVMPAHAQTSVTAFTLAGNIDLTGVVQRFEPKSNSIIDLFVGTAHAQEVGPELGGACLLIMIDGSTLTFEISFSSNPSISLQGTLSGNSFTGTGEGITINGTVDLSGSVQTATGTIQNSQGAFNFSLNSNSLDCVPIAQTTTPAPVSTTTTTSAPVTTTTTSSPVTTTTTTVAPG